MYIARENIIEAMPDIKRNDVYEGHSSFLRFIIFQLENTFFQKTDEGMM